MDNITSNIIKYADPQYKVEISTVNSGDLIGFAFQNTEKKMKGKKESTGVGLQSISNMMNKMGGTCRIIQGNGVFRIEIFFPDIGNAI